MSNATHSHMLLCSKCGMEIPANTTFWMKDITYAIVCNDCSDRHVSIEKYDRAMKGI